MYSIFKTTSKIIDTIETDKVVIDRINRSLNFVVQHVTCQTHFSGKSFLWPENNFLARYFEIVLEVEILNDIIYYGTEKLEMFGKKGPLPNF